jgi:uncharacterized protein (DUF2252 family)
MWNPNPLELARWQLERDRAATERFPGLFERKLARMVVSPLAFLRGSAPLFYRLLSEHPELRDGPAGEGWLCGDAHLENFGVYRTESEKATEGRPEPTVVFDVNDFDEAVVGPFRYDVLRLATSMVLAARQLGVPGNRAVTLALALVDSYADTVSMTGATGTNPPAEPQPVTALVAKATRRSHHDLLGARTVVVDGKRRFVRGPRYADLPPDLQAAAPAAFSHYVQGLHFAERKGDRFDVQDVAFRIAGTGSLGGLRIAVLTRGKSDDDAGWLFDMKEEGTPSAAPVMTAPPVQGENPALRVVTAIKKCLGKPPRMIGTSEIAGIPLFVRRLTPQEDKLNFATVATTDLEAIARYFGALVGRAHRRGATVVPSRWTEEECGKVVDHAVVLAGWHESTYLSFCKLKP